MTTITLLHPGSMGAAVGQQAVLAGHHVLWVPDGRSPATHQRANNAGLMAAPSLAAALEQSEFVISVCPPQAAGDVAAEVGRLGFTGLYVDANAITPRRIDDITKMLHGPVLDGAIIGPPPGGRKTARLYLAGDQHSHKLITNLFNDTAVQVRQAGDTLGAASALKMAFASFQKSARTLAALAHALADTHGVADLLTEEAQAMPSAILADREYLPSVAARAWRWREEMRDIAETLREAGLPADIADATATVMSRWDGDKDHHDLPLAEVFAHLRENRDAQS
ncbi:DUF1932 domain-containing protein [Streptomyces sp. NPDC049555]|uniref:DUF1932 domain-containing protein n=1 Tax=Streptomyces sp. NPDC049555 TaxID=3154930 RepID=UPI003413753B